jgi:phage shock protein PspC (stress-responsive transcriptional regulator)
MKKTININLGGQPFIIDEPAFDILHSYFEALKVKFTNDEERREIISDIESRIAEIFTQRLGKIRAVVAEEDVVYVISLMGRPEDIAGEPDSPSPGQSSTASSSTYTGPVEKKFFRDPDNKKVGGVISGLCYYFGWSDPSWIRIAILGIFILSIFTPLNFGIPLAVIYLILLIVVPEASTSAEKLQMQGKPVTLQNIEKEVRDAMTTAGNSVNTLLKDNSTGSRIIAVLYLIAKAFAKIALVFIVIICALLMLALMTSFFGLSMLSSASLTDITHLLVSNRYIIMLFNIGLLLTIGVPLVSIMYDAIRYLTGNRAKNTGLKRVLWGGWFIGVLMLAFSSWSVFRFFAASDTVNDKVQLVMPSKGTLHVQMADTLGHVLDVRNDDDKDISAFVHFDGLSKTPFGFAFSDIKLEIAVSPDTNFYVERVAFSKGINFADAGKNIQMIKYRFSQTDSVLNLDDKFEIPKDGKWRAQRIKIRIYVPEGHQITFAENVDQIDASVKGNDYFDDGEVSSKTLHVEQGKIKCLNCKEKMISGEDGNAPEPPDAPDANDSDSSNLKHVSVNINQQGVTVVGKNDKSEKVKVRVNENGVSVTKTDSLGNTHKVK